MVEQATADRDCAADRLLCIASELRSYASNVNILAWEKLGRIIDSNRPQPVCGEVPPIPSMPQYFSELRDILAETRDSITKIKLAIDSVEV